MCGEWEKVVCQILHLPWVLASIWDLYLMSKVGGKGGGNYTHLLALIRCTNWVFVPPNKQVKLIYLKNKVWSSTCPSNHRIDTITSICNLYASRLKEDAFQKWWCFYGIWALIQSPQIQTVQWGKGEKCKWVENMILDKSLPVQTPISFQGKS